MISFQKLTEQGRRSDGTLKNLGKDCRGGYSWQLPQTINKYRPLHLTFLSNLSSLPMKTTGYVLAFFHHGKFCRKPTGQNITGSFFESRNSTSVSQGRATLERERCRFTCRYRMLEKREDILRSRQADSYRDLQNIVKFLSSRQHEQRKVFGSRCTSLCTCQFWRSSARKCSMAVSVNDNTILVLSLEQWRSF